MAYALTSWDWQPKLCHLSRHKCLLLSVPQAAKILGISQCTLRNWIQRKKIARVKVGGRVMFRPDTIREFIAYNTRPASG